MNDSIRSGNAEVWGRISCAKTKYFWERISFFVYKNAVLWLEARPYRVSTRTATKSNCPTRCVLPVEPAARACRIYKNIQWFFRIVNSWLCELCVKLYKVVRTFILWLIIRVKGIKSSVSFMFLNALASWNSWMKRLMCAFVLLA